MKKLTVFVLLQMFLLIGGVYAQKTVKSATKFSSVYTNLDKDCKTIKGGEGTDDASDCKGAGGYRIQIWASAAAEHIAAELPDKSDRIMLATQGFDFSQKKVKVEWRLADGKPFAIIMRVSKYGDETDENNPYIGKKIGEELIVMGLKGFENIDFKIDSKTPDANVKAREMADSNYKTK